MASRRLFALAAILGAAVAATLLSASPRSVAPVYASAGGGITAYISPPFVQGPPSSTNAVIQDFNTSNFCSNLGSSNVGTFSGSCTSPQSSDPWGGANTTSNQPTVGGTPSRYVAALAPGGTPQVLTASFAANSEARYIGFWWSAGSANNQVRIYSEVNGSDVLAATFTTNSLNLLLNTSGVPEDSVLPPDPYPGSAMVTALDGSQYNKGHYFGRPADHTTLTPTALPLGLTRANIHNNIYSHAYLNIYASGSTSFSRIEFVGGGFEIDNLAVSTQMSTPSQELVLLQSVLGKSVEFRANGGIGSMPAQTSDTASTLPPNAFTRVGYTFAGWHSNPSGTGGTDYADGAQYPFTNDTVLYAQWTAVATPSTSTSSTTTTTAPTTTPAPTPTTTVAATEPVAPSSTTATVSGDAVSQLAAQESSPLPATGSTTRPLAALAVVLVVSGVVLVRRRLTLSSGRAHN